MELTRQEENKNKAISATVTLFLFALFILFLILYKLITPNPPFPESGGGGGQELALGMINVGNDDLDYSAMGKVTDVVEEKSDAPEQIVTAEGGEDVQITESKPEIKEDKMVIKPVPPVKPTPVVEKTEAEKLRDKIINKQSGGGLGNNSNAGKSGDPLGDPDKDGQGGEGNSPLGKGNGNGGPGEGIGGPGGIGNGKYGIDLKGRAVVQPPKLPKDTEEEGKVVVEITVDAQGNVIEADPNGRGTTTSSATLKRKAAMAAKATKFNVDGKFDEQKGTITIIFSFK